MRAVALCCLLALLALAALSSARAEKAIPHEDLSLLDLTMQLPSDPSESSDGMSAEAVAKLHAAAGSEADEAIAEAQRQSMLMETDSIAAASGPSKWDASVPEIHLKTATRPEEVLSTELETVDHLDHARSWMVNELTAPQQLMAAFPKASPAILGEDHSFMQQQAQQTQQVAAQQQAAQQIVVATEATAVSDSESEADSGALTEAEAAAGVMTLADLQQMMELEGYSQQEIDQYMESLGQQTLDVEADAETEGEAEAETDAETEAEVDAAVSAESETEGETESEAEAEAEATQETESSAETEGEAATEVQATAEELAFYEKDSAESGIPALELLEIERRAQAEEEARLAKEAEEKARAEQEQAAEVEQEPALVEQSAESQGASDADAEAEGEQEAVMASDMDAASQTDSEVEAEAEAQAQQEGAQEEVIHLQDHAQPEVLQESAPSTVTPIHSRAFNKRHPTLSKIASAAAPGYSLPQPSLVETGSRTRAQSYQRSEELDTTRFNPSAVQLGPSKDLYGYVPMTGAEFLHSPQQPASLAQVSMQLQNQGKAWLPPPIESQATPAFVVGMGGLMPNQNAGPYQGQYALAAGAQPVPQQPAFIQY